MRDHHHLKIQDFSKDIEEINNKLINILQLKYINKQYQQSGTINISTSTEIGPINITMNNDNIQYQPSGTMNISTPRGIEQFYIADSILIG